MDNTARKQPVRGFDPLAWLSDSEARRYNLLLDQLFALEGDGVEAEMIHAQISTMVVTAKGRFDNA